ncbi:protein GID8 homolog isoform X4 [Abrus precatorius]|uniref:Protein GID8 homolog isoform X4 n=1 Tax=Abrus precatorius TaxID=3816 RepID=A0A8B8M765_ABRPR|nr:protein GID8 homolog isoform X4 [Abrus precatorius]
MLKLLRNSEWNLELNVSSFDSFIYLVSLCVYLCKISSLSSYVYPYLSTADIDLATITDRMAVKKAVQSGNVEDAIEKVNDLNPEQRLIELIRNGKVEEALEFAQEELAPRGEENQSFLEELERTVALLAFEDVSNCPVGELLDISQRLKTASEVNAAILTSQSHEKDPKLPSLLKMLIWAQNQLDEKAAYPRISDLSTAILEDPTV